MKKVLILGGGFAGVQAAIELQKSKKFLVTLVSDHDYMYIYPISIWIPVGKKSFDEVKIPLSKIQKKYPFELINDSVKSIQAEKHLVVCEKSDINYDYLIIGIGADKMKHAGIENTLSICGKPEVSVTIHEELEKLIRKGHGKIAIGFGGNPKDQSAVRGGPAFELAFNIHQLLMKKKIRSAFELTFFAPMAEPGARMGDKALVMLDKMFRKDGIAKRFGKKIRIFEKDGVVFEDDSKLEADLILFIPASTGHSVLQNSDLPLNVAGFVQIDDHCKVSGLSDVYAIGDSAALHGPAWVAKQGHIAEVMGRNAAHNIIEAEKGSSKRKGYQEHLNILCVMDTGNGAAFVLRDHKKAFIVPLPVIGHWMKQGWGAYAKLTKVGKFPRLPGL